MPPAPPNYEDNELVKALKLTPSSVSAYHTAGLELDRRGEYHAAVKVMRGAVDLSPRLADLHNSLGRVLYKLAWRVEWEVFKENPGLMLKPRRVPGDEETCWRDDPPTCYPVQNYEESQLWLAEKDFSNRMMSNPSDTDAYLALGRIMRNQSLAACTRALKLEPSGGNGVRAYLTLAHMLPTGGNLGLFRRALQLEPAQQNIYSWYGDALRDVRYYGQANRAYMAALRLAPTRARGYLDLAEVRLKVSMA